MGPQPRYRNGPTGSKKSSPRDSSPSGRLLSRRRNTPSPLYLRVTFLASDMRSESRSPESSVSARASSKVISSSFSRSFSETTLRMSIVFYLPYFKSAEILGYRNRRRCQTGFAAAPKRREYPESGEQILREAHYPVAFFFYETLVPKISKTL